MPSQIPGATYASNEIAVKELSEDTATYHDTGPGEHLAQTSSGVQREWTLEVVLWVEAGVVVDTRLDWAINDLLADGSDGLAGGNVNDSGGLDGLRRSEEFEAWHFVLEEGVCVEVF